MADRLFDAVTRNPRFGLFLLAIVALGPVAIYANNGTVPILVLACLALLEPQRAFRDLRRLMSSPCGLALIALLSWGLISTLWAPGGIDATLRLIKIASIMLAGTLLVGSIGQMNVVERQAAGSAFVGALALLVILVFLELASGGTPAADLKASQSSRFVHLSDLLGTAAPIAAVLIWPVVAILRARTGRWLWPLIGFLFVGVLVYLLPLASSIVALALGGMVFVAAYMKREALAVVGMVLTVYILAVPFLSSYAINLDTIGTSARSMPLSWQHRLEIWRFTATKALERPFFGYGFDASREIGKAANPVKIWNPDGSGRTFIDKGLPLHPHNAALQVWLELGLLGVLILIGGILLTLNWTRRPGVSALSRATASAGLTSFLAIDFLAYGVWESWWHAAAWLMALAVLVAARTAEATANPARSGRSN